MIQSIAEYITGGKISLATANSNPNSGDVAANSQSMVFVVIPAFNSEDFLEKVVKDALPLADGVVIVDDCSRDSTVGVAERLAAADPRVRLVRHTANQGVGGAMLSGYRFACELGAGIIVKMDSDDQMDPAYLPVLVKPILSKEADYVKGNRFLHDHELQRMPATRRFGNMGLSFLTKLASGYWNIFDPTNGYTAINAALVPLLDPARIDRRFFFETSLLLELGRIRAVVIDVSIPARYQDEKSSLSEWQSLVEFPPKLVGGFFHRILYQYFLRDFTAVSLFLVAGLAGVLFGLTWGIVKWVQGSLAGVPATTGTVMIAVLPLILGMQLLLQAAVLDIQNVPKDAIGE